MQLLQQQNARKNRRASVTRFHQPSLRMQSLLKASHTTNGNGPSSKLSEKTASSLIQTFDNSEMASGSHVAWSDRAYIETLHLTAPPETLESISAAESPRPDPVAPVKAVTSVFATVDTCEDAGDVGMRTISDVSVSGGARGGRAGAGAARVHYPSDAELATGSLVADVITVGLDDDSLDGGAHESSESEQLTLTPRSASEKTLRAPSGLSKISNSVDAPAQVSLGLLSLHTRTHTHTHIHTRKPR